MQPGPGSGVTISLVVVGTVAPRVRNPSMVYSGDSSATAEVKSAKAL